MAKRDTFQRTLFSEAYARSRSATVAINAMRYVVEYGRACDDAGRELNVEEYAEHLGMSIAQAYRRRAAFAECFTKQDVFSVWAIVQPILDASNFKNEGARAQAVFAGSIKATWTVP